LLFYTPIRSIGQGLALFGERRLVAELTTTSYTILGWLAVRSWSSYELAKQIRLNLRFFWPRAESQLYQEPRRLVELKLVTAERSYVGKRPRTVYTITPAGREVLATWIAEPSGPPQLWFDGLVRIFFGNFGTPDALLGALAPARERADEIQAAGTVVARQYLNNEAPFPQRVHMSGIVFDFLWDFAELLRDWADRASEEIGTWDDTDPTGKEERAREIFRRALAAKAESSRDEGGRRTRS
jgi:DNA-binding PadR family transcriptional regulator